MKIENIECIRVSIPFETGGKRQGMHPGLTPGLGFEPDWQALKPYVVSEKKVAVN